MPKVEISSPKQMPLIPQTKWVYHVYLCVFFWFSELKQIGSATTNAKGPHQLFFLFVFVCHLFCISTWVCLRVCLFFLLLCSCEYYWHTRYKTCHKPRPGLYGPGELRPCTSGYSNKSMSSMGPCMVLACVWVHLLHFSCRIVGLLVSSLMWSLVCHLTRNCNSKLRI